MAEIREVIGSGSITEATKGRESTAELRYAVTGTSNSQIVLGLVFGASPTVFNYLPRGDVSITPTDHEVWECTVSYKMPDEEEENEDIDRPGFNFDTSGGTFHISHSLETLQSYSAIETQPPPNFKGGINVSKDEIKGSDVIIPALRFTETHKFPAANITPTFIKNLARNTGKTNDAEWRGFEKGELLFMGCSGTYEDVVCSITYTFRASENIEELSVPPFEDIAKGGHELLWIFYVDEEDDDAGELIKGPRAAYVERIYEEFDFADLNIGSFPPEKRQENNAGREPNAEEDDGDE